jgi:chemotaxis protein methyltransferase CheR
MTEGDIPLGDAQNEKIEIDLLLQAIYLKYGYDFRSYAKASIRRRVRRHLAKTGLPSVSQMLHRTLYDPTYFEGLLLNLTINVTEMFRDPLFFKTLREVLPGLMKEPRPRVWHAGCASGEEVYAMAILLREEGFSGNCRIYATDANDAVLDTACKGIFPLSQMKTNTRNYQQSGGRAVFASYYTARYGNALMHQDLKQNILFSNHNLTTDGVFGEMDLILCRNVLIYFNRELQDRVLELFWDSLAPGGILCLGARESVRFSPIGHRFETISKAHKIYRKRSGREGSHAAGTH